MLSSLRLRVFLLLSVLITVMAIYVIARNQDLRRAEIERLQTDIRNYTEHAIQRQEEVIANSRFLLTVVADRSDLQKSSRLICDTELAELLRVRPRLLQLSIFRPSGLVACSATSSNQIASSANSPAFRRALDTGQFAVGEYRLDPTTGKPFLDLALPLSDRDGSITAVILTAIDLAWLSDTIGSRILPPGWAIDLVRSDGILVARSPQMPELIGKSIALTDLYTAMKSHGFKGGVESVGLDGVMRSYEVSGLLGEHGEAVGYTIVGISQTETIQAIDKQLRTELIDLAAIMLTILLGGHVVGEFFFTRPIKALVAMTRQIETGHRGIRSGLGPSLGEIGILAGSIDQMMAAIESYENQVARKQQQLTDSQHFARLFDWRWYPPKGPIEVSESIYSILGVKPDSWEASYDSLRQSAHPDDRRRIEDCIGDAMQSKSNYLIEYRAIRSDGSVREFWEQGRCEIDGNGELVAVSATVQDITLLKGTERERKQAIDALWKREEQFRSAMEVSPVGLAVLSPDGSWMFVNQALCQITGRTERELLATSLQTITHPCDQDVELDAILQTLRNNNDSYEAERRLLSNDGRTIWVLLNASAVRDSSGVSNSFILQVHDISERKVFELALKSSEERYRRLVQVNPDAVTVHRNGQLELVNDAALHLFGANRTHEMLGRSILEFIAPDSQSMVQERFHRLQDAERELPLTELRIRRFDGCIVDVEATGCALGVGRERSVITIFRDITLRRQSEQALRDSEEQLRLLADSLPILLARVDRDGRYLFLNLEGERRCALRRSEVLGRSLAEVLGPTEFAKVQPHFQRALSGEHVTFATQIRYPNGDERDVEVFYIPDLAPDGNARGVFMVSIDVTDRIKAEAELKESGRRFRQLVESTNAIPYTWSFAAQRYTYLGAQAERLFGCPVQSLMDRLFWLQRIHPDDQEQVLKHLKRCESDRHDAQIAYRIISGDGKILWLNDTVAIETTADGERVGHGIIFDTTENRLRDRQIEEAQKIEALGRMTGGIAHDFNNLLTVIVINLELVERKLSGRTEQHRVAQALQAANIGTELTSRMLAFARRQVLRPTQINLNDLVTDFHGMIQRTFESTIEVRMELAEVVWPVRVDRAALETALLNLTVNARDAMPDGGVLTITTANVSIDDASASKRPGLTAGEYAMLAVSDTGSGMTPEVLARAFEPFFTTKEVGKGTGLGLSMVYGFVKQSNSFAYIDSDVGRGTAVKLYFPKTETQEIVLTSDLAKPEGLPSGNETVLVVEDSAALRSATASLLKSLGYRVLQAHDGPSALQQIDKHLAIDLMLSDIVMPGGMKGPDLARRALELRPRLKLLYMTGYADDPRFREGLVEPHGELISKPFHSEALAAKVRTVLDTRKAPRRSTTRRSRAKT